MIHLNVAFLSNSLYFEKYCQDSNKRLATCCKQVHELRTFPRMYCYNMADGMHHVQTVYERVST